MKKTQKKLGNKGFSLVELIVVIAIMAVLVGVLAPTLIRNVEKSRESSDLQTLDSIRSSVTTALSVEDVNQALGSNSFSGTIDSAGSLTGGTGSTAATFVSKLSEELSADGVLQADLMKSKACKDKNIAISIDINGKVTVSVPNAGATKSKIAMVAE